MTIEKDGTIYVIAENATSWTVSTNIGRVAVSYNVPKDDCPTFDTLRTYITESDVF